MNDVFSLWLGLSSEMSIRWGLTLLHFLWQGTLIGLLALIAAKLLRHQAAVVRYWLHSVALMACPLCVAMTFAMVEIPKDFQVTALPETSAIPELPGPLANGNLASLNVPYPQLSAVAPAANITQNSNATPGITDATASGEPTVHWLPVVAQWMTILYSAGVFCFLFRLGVALWGGQRLRAISRPMSDSVLLELVRDQAKRIGLRIVPVVAYCERVAVPTVISLLRPMILLPATLMTGLSPDEFSAILSHELAHIRRYDLWMNLMQRVIESLLFFHPVVWFLSRRLSAEREICCDDLVVRSGHEPMNYAGALLRMAELCVTQNGPKLAALSADGQSRSELERRIQRLMNLRHGSSLRLTRVGVMIIAIATMSSAVVPTMLGAWAQSDVSAETQAAAVAIQESDLPFEWSIPGTVTDEKGKPVAGAIIETLPGLQKQVSTTSADNGQFVLEMRSKSPRGIPFVVTSSDETLKSFVQGIDYGSPPRLTRVVLKPARNITVTVKDMAGLAQNGATIGAVTELLIASATTDEHGRATLRIPADAEIDWIFGYLNHSGFDYFENYNAFPTQERLTLPDQITLTLAGAENVKVRVVDSDENPVSGVNVMPWTVMVKGKLSYFNFSSLPNLATTDDSGIAEFPWIPAGLERGVSFLIRHPKYHCPKLPEYESTGSGMTARVLRVASVRGKVTLADGSPVSGVHLQAEGRGNTTRYFRGHTVTHDDGTYEFDLFPDQSTIIAITDTSYAAKSHMDILLKEGQSREDFDFVVNDGTLIRGTITLGNDQFPAVGDTATLIQSSGGTDLVRWSTTDTNGRYRFRVGPGRYELRLPNQEVAAPIMIDVKDEAELIYDGHAERRSRVNLSGTVTDASGIPVANCKVYGETIVALGHAGFQTTTNAEGKFNSERWSDRMMLYVVHGEKQLAGYTVIAEDTTAVDVTLAPAKAASGIVRGEFGQPVANVRVLLQVKPPSKVSHGLHLSTTTDERGVYTFDGLVLQASCHVTAYRGDQLTLGPAFTVNDLAPIILDDVVISDDGTPATAPMPKDRSVNELKPAPDAGAEEPVAVRYPYCIVDTENLAPRALTEAVAAFNRISQESPTGVGQPPIAEQETRDAIAKFAAEMHVPKSVRDQLNEILKTGTLPSSVYFRRFTRLDGGRQMQEVWWVRLVVETSDGPVYSVPVRTTALRARPYTQMERQQNAADGLTLINRVVSYYEIPPESIESNALPRASVDALIRRTQEALLAKTDDKLKALFELMGVSESLLDFAVSELRQLSESRIHSIKVSPLKLQGNLLTGSAWQFYKPNLPVVGFLEIEYTNDWRAAGRQPSETTDKTATDTADDDREHARRADAQPLAEETRKTLSLELGFVSDELRLVNYIADGKAKPPERIDPVSIRGHIEPLADGTHLITDVITNPGTLLSAHLANEEVRQRDFSRDAAESKWFNDK